MPTAPFIATTSADAITAEWWIEIEGIRRRYGTVDSGIADTGTNRPIRDWIEVLPEFRGQQAEPLDGSTKPHEYTVKIVDVDDELTDLFSVHDDTCGIAFLAAAVAAGAVNVTVDDASVFTAPCDVYINRETMRCTNIVGNVLTVTRGMYGSLDVAHPITDSQGNALSVMVADKPRFMHTREVVLCEGRRGLTEADAIRIRGYLDGVEESEGVWTLSCSGYLRRLSCQIGETLGEAILTYDLSGQYKRDRADTTWCIRVDDASTMRDAGHVIIDSEIIKYIRKAGAVPEWWLDLVSVNIYRYERPPYYFGRGVFSEEIFGDRGVWIERVHHEHELSGWEEIFRERVPILMAQHNTGAKVRQVMHSDDFTGGTGPAAVILQLLTSTGTGLNGAYDTLPAGWGAGIPVARIEVTEIEEICGLIPSIDFAPFAIVEAVELKEWLEENILRPSLLFLVETPDGTITVRRMWSRQEAEAFVTPVTMGHDELLGLPDLTMGDPPIGEFTFKINWDPGGDKFYGRVNVILGDGRERYKGTARNYEIECKTIYDSRIGEGRETWRSVNQGDVPETLRCYLAPIWENYSLNPCPKVSFELAYNRYIDVYVGQVVRLTCAVTPDLKSSARGLAGEWFQVVEATPNPERSCIEVVAWMIGVHDDPLIRQLAPSALVTGYTDPSPAGAPAVRVDIADSRFTDPGVAGYEYDVDGFAVGDRVMIVDARYRPLAGAAAEEADVVDTGGAPGGFWIDLAAAPANPPAADDYLTTGTYDNCQVSQRVTWAFLGDAAGTLGVGADPAHRRER